MRIKNTVATFSLGAVMRKKVAIMTALVTLITVSAFAVFSSLAAPGTTYLGGLENGSDLLRIAITNDGGTNLQRYNPQGNCSLAPGATGSCWTRQYFAGNGSGLVFYANGQIMFWGGNEDANFEDKSDNVNISVGNSVVSGGKESISRTWTGTGPASGIVLDEVISLPKGSLEYTRSFVINNNTGAALTDVRLIVGGDTQFANDDNGYTGHTTAWDGHAVYTYTDSAPGRMFFSGYVSGADRYFAGNFNLGRIYAKEDAWLTNEVSGSSEATDTGYYLQWGDGTYSIAAGAQGAISMREVLMNTTTTGIEITPPAAQQVTPDTVVDLTFEIENLSGELINLGPITAASQSGFATTVDTSNAALSFGNPVEVEVSVTVPSSAAAGLVDRITLTVPFSGISADTATASVDLTIGGDGILYGDVNDDESVDAADVTLSRRYVAGWAVTINAAAADVNVDDSVDAADVTLLRRFIAGWPLTLGPQSGGVVMPDSINLMADGMLTITAGSVSGEPGDVVEVPVILSDNGLDGRGIGAINNLRIQFDDTRLEWAGTAAESIINGGMLDAATPQGANFSSSHVILSFDSEEGTKASGTLVTLRLKIKDDAPAGDVPLATTVNRIYDDSLMLAVIPASEYDIVSGKVTVISDSPKPTPTVSQVSFNIPTGVVYNASAQPIPAPTAASGVTGLGAITVRYAGAGGTTYPESATAPTNAGSYTVYADIADGAEYAAAKITLGEYAIAKKSISISGATAAAKVYDGTTTAAISAVTFSGLEGGETLAITTDYTATGAAFNSADAGTNKTVTATVALVANSKTNNYTLSSGALSAGSQTITKATPTVGLLDYSIPAARTYNAAPQAVGTIEAKTGVTGLGAIAARYAGASGTTYAESATAPTNAGSYTVYADIAEGTNYLAAKIDLSGSSSYMVISKKSISISGSTIAPKTYDGTTAATVSAISFTGLEGGQSMLITTDYSVTGAAFDNANAGTNRTVTGTVALVANSKTDNYTLSSGALSVGSQTIAKASAAGVNQEFGAKAGTASTYTFDLRTLLPSGVSAAAVSAYGVGTVTGDIYTTTPSVSGYELSLPIASTTAGNAKSVIAINFTSSNYDISSANITVNITDRTPIAISGVSVAGKVYNGSPVTISGTPVFTDTVSQTTIGTLTPVYVWKTSADAVLGGAPTDAGSYKLVVSADGGVDYEVADLEINFVITKADQEITFTCPVFGHVGDTITLSASISTGLAGIVFSSQTPAIATVSGNTLSLLAEGIAVIEASHPGSTNYNSASRTCSIAITLRTLPGYAVLQQFADFNGIGDRTAIIDADAADFGRLLLDGVEVDSDDYTVMAGSTIITLSEAYLQSLTPGTHVFLAEFNDGAQVPLNLNVLAGIGVPNTGLFGLIANYGALSSGLALLSATVLSVAIMKRKGSSKRMKIKL